MRFFKSKGMVLGLKEDAVVQSSDMQKDIKYIGQTLEIPPVKKMMIDILDGHLERMYKQLDNRPERFRDDLLIAMDIVRDLKTFIESLPDILYSVERVDNTLLRINGLDGSCYELSLLKNMIGGKIYQLRDVSSDKIEEIISVSFEGYLSIVEKSCVGGYLIPDELLSKALENLRKGKE